MSQIEEALGMLTITVISFILAALFGWGGASVAAMLGASEEITIQVMVVSGLIGLLFIPIVLGIQHLNQLRKWSDD